MWSVESSAEVDASAADVWRLYADPETWSRWGHSTAAATADGPLAAGTMVTVKPTRGPAQRVRVVTFEPERQLTTEMRLPGARMTFDYQIEPLEQGCRVRHRVAMDGPLSGVFGLFMRSSDARKLDDETARLAREVKAQA